ncbi:hypothetical protein AKO1_006311 [Acrasis kona]|uniref:Uncharacterized protein n=1 Tax=Acrasis kona TaxID=1008807 RepID=A0AAW2YHE7_9EUKA
MPSNTRVPKGHYKEGIPMSKFSYATGLVDNETFMYLFSKFLMSDVKTGVKKSKPTSSKKSSNTTKHSSSSNTSTTPTDHNYCNNDASANKTDERLNHADRVDLEGTGRIMHQTESTVKATPSIKKVWIDSGDDSIANIKELVTSARHFDMKITSRMEKADVVVGDVVENSKCVNKRWLPDSVQHNVLLDPDLFCMKIKEY